MSSTGFTSQQQRKPNTNTHTAAAGASAASTGEFALISSAFANGEKIPKEYTGEDQDLSPPLSWTSTPADCVELALLAEDPDAPQPEPWVHWILYGMDPSTREIPEGLERDFEVPSLEARQGENSFHKVGYGGPLPPPGHGWHRYHFRLFALDRTLEFARPPTKAELMEAIAGHVLAETELVGVYRR